MVINMKKLFTSFVLSTLLLFTVSCTLQKKEVTADTTAIKLENNIIKEYSSSKVINPFRNLKVSFTGEANKGIAIIDTSCCEAIVKDNFTFTCDNNGNLVNGSIATIKAEYDKNAFEASGCTITTDQKSYIITGVSFAPEELRDFEKDNINSALRKLADDYIENNIQSMKMEYDSRKDRDGWSKSGSFNYTYNYHDDIMIYNYSRYDSSDNAYYIIYELSNKITCTEDMTSGKNPMVTGETDTGWAYIVVGTPNITATSDMMFNSDFNKKEASEFTRSFTKYEDAIDYCTYGGNYITLRELFT